MRSRPTIDHFLSPAILTLAVGLCALSLDRSLCADDWPGLLGPDRNGHAAISIDLDSNTPASLRPAWRLEAGQGYAGAAMKDGRAYLYDRFGNQDRVRAVDARRGNVLWEKSLLAKYRGGIDADKGPRCVPSIAEENVIVYSAAGELTALSTKNGEVRWTRDLKHEYLADDGYFGAGSTPLVLGDRIVVSVGGKKGGVVAVRLSDGSTLWATTDYDASYASPIAIPLEDNMTAVVVPTRLKTVGIDSQTGKLLWETPFGQRGPTVNAATPIRCQPDQLFLTASYGIGNVTLRAGSSAVDVIHQGFQLSSQYASPVYHAGWIYGSDGREDMGNVSYKCLDPLTGNVAWEEVGLPICHSLLVGSNRLLLIGIDGQLWHVDATPEKFSVRWKGHLDPAIYRALPALADGRLIVRSNGNLNEWQAIALE